MGTRTLPDLVPYQSRSVSGAATAAIRHKKDVMLESPTGSGKTAMLARIARQIARHGGKALILTHRKNLLLQMSGNPEAETEKERLGEIDYWSGIKPGTIADPSLGGIDQDASIVVGMVETVARRLDKLEGYTHLIIDEVQHVSEGSATRELAGSYVRVINALGDAGLIGASAITCRGDGDNLHPRFETAHREVVSIEEARAEGRVVPAETVIGKAPLKSGRRVADLVQMEFDGKLEGRTASAVLAEERGPEFYDHVVEDWDRLAKRKKTILFVDSIDEIKMMQRLFDQRYGEGAAVSMHGELSDRQNRDAVKSYAGGGADVLIACQMIGEGFDVPATDVVMSMNRSLSRLEMNQYVGRCVRAALNKVSGKFIDYGTASHIHGHIEAQHNLQNIDALSASGSAISAARAIGRMAPVREGDWMAVCGEKRSFFIQSMAGKFAVFERRHGAEKEDGRRASKKNGSMDKIVRFDHPEHGRKLLGPGSVAGLLAEHARDEAAWLSRLGGIESEAYEEKCRESLDRNQGMFRIIETTSAMERTARGRSAREEALESALQDPENGGQGIKLLRKALLSAANGEETVREGLRLAGTLLGHCSLRNELSFGRRAEARSVTEEIDKSDMSDLKPSRLRAEAEAALVVMKQVGKDISDEGIRALFKDISDPMEQGLTRMQQERKKRMAARG